MRFVCPDGDEAVRDEVEEMAARILTGHTLEWFSGQPATIDAWRERASGADGLLLMWGMPRGVMSACPAVRIVSFTGTGVGKFVDLEEAAGSAVIVCNVPAYGANAVAEHAIALMFAVARRIAAGDRLVRDGYWRQDQGLELRGRRLGVIGVGPVGTRVIEIARGIGLHPIAWTRSPSPERAKQLGVPFASLDEIFATADIVTLHLAHTPDTERMIDARLLGAMSRDAILINTARAELVDTAALLGALDAGGLFGVGIDVFDAEPPTGSPLLAHDRVVLSPHVGFATPESTRELMRIAVENLRAFADGAPQNRVAAQ